MKKKFYAAGFVAVVGLSLAAAQGDNQTRFDSVMKEVVGRTQDCRIDLLKAGIAASEQERSYFVKRTETAAEHLQEVSQTLAMRGVRLTFGYYGHPKFRGCVLSEEALTLNPGSVDAIEYLYDTLRLEPKKPLRVQAIRIVVSPFQSQKLYAKNAKLKIREKPGRRAAVIYVNAGDYEAGLSNESVYSALFGG